MKNLTGIIFDELTVISEADRYIQPNGKTVRKWNCLCSCGNEVVVFQSNLGKGHTKSCGCLKEVPAFVRFWKYVVEEGRCWKWIGAVRRKGKGYGIFRNDN